MSTYIAYTSHRSVKSRVLPVLIFALILMTASCTAKKPAVTSGMVENGIIDLSNADLGSGRTFRLDGNWEFYSGRLLSPEEIKKYRPVPTGYFPVPLYWTEYRGLNLPAKGVSTYRITIKTDGSPRLMGIKVPEIFTEYRILINGNIIDEHGSFINRRPRFLRPDIYTFNSNSDTIELVLQVKNLYHGNAGIGQSFYIGESHHITRDHIISIITEMVLIAICIFAGLYHVILFIFRSGEKELLFFGLFCLVIAARTISTGNTLIMLLFPDLIFPVGSRIATSVIPLSVLTFLLFVYYFFKNSINRRLFVILFILNSLYLVMVFCTSTFFYSSAFTWYLLVVLVSSVFTVYTSIIAAMKKNMYAMIFITGFIFLFAGITNDILHYKQFINTGYYLCLFFTAFILAQSVMLAIKFANEHRLVMEMSEKLVTIDRLKDEFLANTSHELRTPLTGIIGIGESLIDGIAGRLPDTALNNLRLLVSSGKRLSSLINDILDFSKLRNNDIIISKKAIDLRQITSVVLSIISTTVKDKKLIFKNDISEEFPCVMADENRLQQILYNLAGNAVKFTREGYVKVSAEEHDGKVIVCIEDTGSGIPADKMDIIFRSFEQGDGSVSREYGGTGLGLTITKKLVELHGGTIWVESEQGKGSKFFFSLGKATADTAMYDIKTEVAEMTAGNAVISNETQFSIPGSTCSGHEDIRILVVDDEDINIQVLLNFLALGHYRADYATNGHDALEMISSNRYDLVLLDIMMPRMSGFEVCRKLRESYSRIELPVLILTAKNRPEDIVAAFDAGANDYLPKPVDRHELFARVETQLALTGAIKKAIENADLANIDPLTGMYNRRYFFNAGELEFLNMMREDKELSILMIDIDKFKEINDRHGHAVGDIVIKCISSIILKNIRGGDIAGRYGGDEFIVILPGTDAAGASFLAEKIRRIVRNEVIYSANRGELKFTISIGVASLNDRISTFNELVMASDKMLYGAKQKGRNRIDVC